MKYQITFPGSLPPFQNEAYEAYSHAYKTIDSVISLPET